MQSDLSATEIDISKIELDSSVMKIDILIVKIDTSTMGTDISIMEIETWVMENGYIGKGNKYFNNENGNCINYFSLSFRLRAKMQAQRFENQNHEN